MAGSSNRLKHTVAVAFGNGDNGRLGIGHLKGAIVPTVVGALLGQDVAAVAAGETHSLFLTRDGTVYASGGNASGELGLGRDVRYVVQPSEVLVPEPIVSIAAGWGHSLAVGESGNLWAWGDNKHGQLGLGQGAGLTVPEPRLVKALEGARVRSIAGGLHHSMCSTAVGEVFSFGSDEVGQLGRGGKAADWSSASHRDESLPLWIKALQGVKVAQVACGMAHSAALDKDGQLHTWGQLTYGALGLGKAKDRTFLQAINSLNVEPTPRHVQGLPALSMVSLGGTHSAAVSKEGHRVFVWGTDMRGSLGLGQPSLESMAASPTQIPNLRLSSVSCGWKHNLGVDPLGRIVAWGWGGAEDPDDLGRGGEDGELGGPTGGQLGLGNQVDVVEPRPVGYIHPLGGQNPLHRENEPWNPELAAWTGLAAQGAVSAGLNHSLAVVEVRGPRPMEAPKRP